MDTPTLLGILSFVMFALTTGWLIRSFLLVVGSFDYVPGRTIAVSLFVTVVCFAVGLTLGVVARDMRIDRTRSSSTNIVALAAVAETKVFDRYGRYSTSLLDLKAVSPRFAAAEDSYSGTVKLSRSDVTSIIYIDALDRDGHTRAQLRYSTANKGH